MRRKEASRITFYLTPSPSHSNFSPHGLCTFFSFTPYQKSLWFLGANVLQGSRMCEAPSKYHRSLTSVLTHPLNKIDSVRSSRISFGVVFLAFGQKTPKTNKQKTLEENMLYMYKTDIPLLYCTTTIAF